MKMIFKEVLVLGYIKTGNLVEIFDACAVVPQLYNCRIYNKNVCKQIKNPLEITRSKQSFGLVKSF